MMNNTELKDKVNGTLDSIGQRPMSAMQIDQNSNFSDELNDLMGPHMEKWMVGGLDAGDIAMSMSSTLIFTGLKILQEMGCPQDQANEMMGVTVRSMYSDDNAELIEELKKRRQQNITCSLTGK
jgi:hypothetical protein